jgi:two-component system, OmpR family, phosphate regulon response regulator PhoB
MVTQSEALILVVEDDDAIAEIYQVFLVAAGYRVARAANGVEGLLLEDQLSPDLIILDMHMPVLGGLDMLKRRDAKQRTSTPVIVSSNDPTSEPAALEAGAALFLPKLLEAGDLLAAIDLTLRRADAGAEARRSRAGDVLADQERDGARREPITARLDANDRELTTRIAALVKWLAGYYEVGAAWVDVLRQGNILVEAVFHRRTKRLVYDVVHRVVLSENIADARTPFLVGDLQAAPWLRTHPAARAGFRFFAGVPLRGPEQVRIGALCIADIEARGFDAANLLVLQHCGTEFGHRIAHLAGANVTGPFLYESPGIFSGETMSVLLGAELMRAHRRPAAFELALVRLRSDDVERAAQCAQRVQQAVEGRGCAVATHAPSVLAVLVRGDDSDDTRARMDKALRALRRHRRADVAAAGVVAHASGSGVRPSAADVTRAAEALLASVPADGWMRREELRAPTETTAPQP